MQSGKTQPVSPIELDGLEGRKAMFEVDKPALRATVLKARQGKRVKVNARRQAY